VRDKLQQHNKNKNSESQIFPERASVPRLQFAHSLTQFKQPRPVAQPQHPDTGLNKWPVLTPMKGTMGPMGELTWSLSLWTDCEDTQGVCSQLHVCGTDVKRSRSACTGQEHGYAPGTCLVRTPTGSGNLSEIPGSQSDEYEDGCLPGCGQKQIKQRTKEEG
jgi:hypothetical protein